MVACDDCGKQFHPSEGICDKEDRLCPACVGSYVEQSERRHRGEHLEGSASNVHQRNESKQ